MCSFHALSSDEPQLAEAEDVESATLGVEAVLSQISQRSQPLPVEADDGGPSPSSRYICFLCLHYMYWNIHKFGTIALVLKRSVQREVCGVLSICKPSV
jgi:hypothetical protein